MARTNWLCLLAFTLTGVAHASAAELQRSDVPAKAEWFLHLDVEEMLQTPLASDLKKTDVVKTLKLIGLDSLTDVKSLTAWSTNRHCVLSGRLGAARGLLKRWVEAGQDHTTVEYRGRTIHSWLIPSQLPSFGDDAAHQEGDTEVSPWLSLLLFSARTRSYSVTI